MTTGERIRSARKIANITQQELADRLGIPYQSIGQWERNLRNPKYETLQRIAEKLGVPISELLPDESIIYCEDCGLEYDTSNTEQVRLHEKRHTKWEQAVQQFGFCWNYILREKIKAAARNRIQEGSLSETEYVDAQTDIFKALFSRSLQASGYSVEHVTFPEYVSMLLNQDSWKKQLPPRVYEKLVAEYGAAPGIDEGTYYAVPQTEQSPFDIAIDKMTVAAEKLNDTGLKEAIKRVEELAEIPKYQRQGTDPTPTENGTEAPETGKK